MMTHTVLFCLKPGLDEAGRAEFLKSLRTLLDIPGSRRAVIGVPAATEPRPVIIQDYHYALELDFEDVAAHDTYQAHPMHQAFVEKCAPLWESVRVVDFEQM